MTASWKVGTYLRNLGKRHIGIRIPVYEQNWDICTAQQLYIVFPGHQTTDYSRYTGGIVGLTDLYSLHYLLIKSAQVLFGIHIRNGYLSKLNQFPIEDKAYLFLTVQYPGRIVSIWTGIDIDKS